jgi:glycosyltransferase involved in cell wall biosynthesis
MPKEKINIISKSATFNIIRGPRKVFDNTCKGLERIGQPYVINQPMSHYRWNWIHDSITDILIAGFLGIPVVAGPNIVVMPYEFPKVRTKLKNSIYLQPSEWVVRLWEKVGFTECELVVWPVGIDCDEFNASNKVANSTKVIIYFKARRPEILARTIQKVLDQGLEPVVLMYGQYEEIDFKVALKDALFGIWIGVHESQGIALQEALASDLPLLVLDASRFSDNYNQNMYLSSICFKNFTTTSAPYFDSKCGIIIDDEASLGTAILKMRQNLHFFEPRDFVLKELSLEASARKFVDFFEMVDDKLPQRANVSPMRYSCAEKVAKMSLNIDKVMKRSSRII